MRLNHQFLLALAPFLILQGCTKGNLLSSKSAQVSAITFAGKPSAEYAVSTSGTCASALTISGECDKRLSKLQLSVDGGTQWQSFSAVSSNSSDECSRGSFSLEVPDICSLLSVQAEASISKTILFRGSTALGVSDSGSVLVVFSSSSGGGGGGGGDGGGGGGTGGGGGSGGGGSGGGGSGGGSTPATVSQVSSSNANGIYKAGDSIDVRITWSKSVVVVGSPKVTLNTSQDATYVSGSGTSEIVFNYVVQSGDNVSDLDAFSSSALTLNGGTIKDSDGVDANLGLPAASSGSTLADLKNIEIDTTAPSLAMAAIVNSSPTPMATYALSFGTVTGTFTQYCILENSTTVGGCSWTSGSLPSTYAVTSTNNAKVLSVWLRDSAGNISSRVDTNSVTLDTTAPTVSLVTSSSANGQYLSGSILVSVNFSESVTVAGGSPSITLETGVTDRVATYTSGSGSSTLVFTYNIVSGDASLDLDYVSTSALSIPGGASISDTAGNSAGVTLPTVGSANSLAGQKNIVIGPMLVPVSPVYSSNGANWNDYVNNDGADVYHATDTSCSDTGTGLLKTKCIHGGERKKVVLTGYSSCANLSISETLGVFDWVCIVDSGTATFFTKGLASGKGLKDLISSGSWQNNSITVTQSSNTVATSTSGAWWNNTISLLPDNSTGTTIQNLSGTGTIYYLSTDRATAGYEVTSDKVAVVTLGSSKLTFNSSDSYKNVMTTSGTHNATGSSNDLRSMIFGGGRKHLWIETNLDGTATAGSNGAAENGILAYNWILSRVHNTTVSSLLTSGGYFGVSFKVSNSNEFSKVKIWKSGSGFEFYGSDFNLMKESSAADAASSTSSLLTLSSSADSNRFLDLNLTNSSGTSNAYGILITSGANNIFSRVNVSNINGSTTSEGLYLSTSASSNIFTQLITTATKDAGIFVSQADSNTLSFVTAANSTWNGLYFTGTGTNSNAVNSMLVLNADDPFQSDSAMTGSGNLLNNIASLSGTTSATNLLVSTGTPFSLSGYVIKPSGHTASGSFASDTSTAVASSALASSVLGKVSSDAQTGTGTLSYSALDTLNEWLGLSNVFRSWGLDGGTFPVNTNQGSCVTGTCRIWDWRVSTSGPVYNRSVSGSSTNTSFPGTTSACPSAYDGDSSDNMTANGFTFMKNAIEIFDDGVGNDNGLCESSEACIYAPNVGAYQGEGSLSSHYCTTNTSSGVTNASLYIYSTLGQ